MYADLYVAEHIVRDRLKEARARAELAPFLRESNQGSLRASGFGHRLLELGRSLVKRRGRRAAGTRRSLEGGALDDLHGETTVL